MSAQAARLGKLTAAGRVPTRWHLLTGEYPPQPGGVSDYSQSVARGLADAGDAITVWAPPCDLPDPVDRGVTVRRLPDRFGLRSLGVLSRALDRYGEPQRLLVQYVPHAFGWKGGNLPFCWWIGRRREPAWVMFHEIAFPFERGAGPARHGLALVNRLMAALVGGAAARAFVSIPAWLPAVQALTRPGTPVSWLPVPSSIPVVADPRGSAAIRARYAAGRPLVGHFGTGGAPVRPLLERCLEHLARESRCAVLLAGRGTDALARSIATRCRAWDGRLHATGELDADEVSRHVAACDVMLQPYSDGVSSRRTSAMTALAHGVPLVTTSGPLTDPVWHDGAARLVPVDQPDALARAVAEVLGDSAARAQLSSRGADLYRDRFDVRHVIDALRRERTEEAEGAAVTS